MPAELHDAIANAEYLLGQALPHFVSGALAGIEHAVGISTLYRQRGVARMLTQGVPEPFFLGQIQSASVYAYGLSRVAPDQQVLSKAAGLWDAIGAQCWEAAEQIARVATMSHNPKREHEDDFLYVAFLLQRYFLAPADDAPEAEREAHAQAQQQRLERWEEVLEGGIDARLGLARALDEGDAEAYAEALLTMADERESDLRRRHDKGALKKAQLAWVQPIWPEGLALVRLGEAREGFDLRELQVPGVPPVLRADNRYAFHPDAWRSIDFRPALRP